MKSKKLIYSLIILISVVIFHNSYIELEYGQTIEFYSVDDGLTYDIFYSNPNSGYSIDKSVQITTKQNYDGVNHNVVRIVQEEPIDGIKIELDTKLNEIKIKNIVIKGETDINISQEQAIAGFNNIDDYQVEDEYLVIHSTQNQPYIELNNINISPEKYNNINYFVLSIIIITVFLLINFIQTILLKLKKDISTEKSVFIIFLLGLIFIPYIFINNDEIDDIENRRLAKFPALKIDDEYNEQFTSDVEEWLNDRFGLRRFYLEVDEFLKSVFQPNRIENEKAFLGKDGWLFYKMFDSVENYQGINLYTEEELQNAVNNIISKNEWLESQGIEYYIMISPDKNLVYGEYYPDYINKVSDNHKYKQLSESLKGSGVNFFTPYDKLMDEKKNNILYYKGDTHWNELGAFYGYETLMNEIVKDFPNVVPLTLDDFEVDETDVVKKDLINVLGYEVDGGMHPTLKKKVPYNYEVLLDDRTQQGIITHNPNAELDVFICRDSYINAMEPYLEETFENVEIRYYQTVEDNQDYIKENKPDIVIETFVGRNIDEISKGEPALKEVK